MHICVVKNPIVRLNVMNIFFGKSDEYLTKCTQNCPFLKFTISINHHEMGNVMLPFGIYQRKQFILTESSWISVKTRHHRGEWDGAKRSLVKRSGEELPEIISPGQVIRYNDHYEN